MVLDRVRTAAALLLLLCLALPTYTCEGQAYIGPGGARVGHIPDNANPAEYHKEIISHYPLEFATAGPVQAGVIILAFSWPVPFFLYRRRRATVEEIRSELRDAPSPSSVRKLLDIMIERGLLAREYDGPRYMYFPAAKPEEASRSALKQLMRTFFNNSPGSAIAALLDMTSTPLSAAEYRRLSSLLKRVREQGDER